MENNGKSDTKKIIIGVLCFLIVVVFALIIVIKIAKPKKDPLQIKLETYAGYYYEYYCSLYKNDKGEIDNEKRTETLSKYTEIGIKVDLENLVRTLAGNKDIETKENLKDKTTEELLDEFTKKGKKCDSKKTKVTLYPSAPYTSKDVRIEAHLECDN